MSIPRGKAGRLAVVTSLVVAASLVWGVQAAFTQDTRGQNAPAASAERAGTASGGQPAPAYHGNVKSKKFHRAGCRHYYCQHCTAVFKTREEAIKAGYAPCKICRP
jgi:hypothetical protein